MKGKIFSIVLLFAFAAPVTTAFMFLQYQKKQVKREVKWKMIAGIDREELVVLKFTEAEKKTELNWKHSKEFEYRGEMYDIVETAVSGDTTTYWLWWDSEETKLNRQLDDLVAQVFGKSPKDEKGQEMLTQFYKQLFYAYAEPVSSAFIGVETTYTPYAENFSSALLTPPSPPPRRS